MNKILNFKQKLQKNSEENKTTSATSTTTTIKNNNNNNNSDANKENEINILNNKKNEDNNNNNRKKVIKSTPAVIPKQPSSIKITPMNTGKNINISNSIKNPPILMQSMFNKGKRSNEITNRKLPLPFSEDLFFNNTNTNNTNTITNTNNINNTNIINNHQVTVKNQDKPIIKKPQAQPNSFTSSFSNRIRDNIILLKEQSKNEYKTRVNEIEKIVLNGNINNTDNDGTLDNLSIETIQKIITVEKEMINLFDQMIELQTSENTTYHQILNTSSRLNNTNNNNNNSKNDLIFNF